MGPKINMESTILDDRTEVRARSAQACLLQLGRIRRRSATL
jgi:hypothetical protein